MDPDTCPTCQSRLTLNPDTGGYERTEGGSYKFRGAEHECNCERQVELRKHYLLANIPDQYMRLNWKEDFDGSETVKKNVSLYLDSWDSFKLHGMGVEFGGRSLGVGKTFAATHIGKELIKRGESVFFIQFLDLISLFSSSSDDPIKDRLSDTNVVILDEVRPAISERQAELFAHQFEQLIRHRTNYNGVTIITTNLAEDELVKSYPRTYSLLSAKQMRIEMSGPDARLGKIATENLELVLHGEVRPIV